MEMMLRCASAHAPRRRRFAGCCRLPGCGQRLRGRCSPAKAKRAYVHAMYAGARQRCCRPPLHAASNARTRQPIRLHAAVDSAPRRHTHAAVRRRYAVRRCCRGVGTPYAPSCARAADTRAALLFAAPTRAASVAMLPTICRYYHATCWHNICDKSTPHARECHVMRGLRRRYASRRLQNAARAADVMFYAPRRSRQEYVSHARYCRCYY